jgi:glycosyltransferase involved in cell wall biosynthesis
MSGRPSAAAVILTFNEQRNLPECLRAIPADVPVLVLDSGSTDATLAIATAAGARTAARAWTGFADQRNFALNGCGLDSTWVLFIDADERFPPAFYQWMAQALADDPPVDVFNVPSVLFLNGRALKHAPGYPVLHPRLVRRGTATFAPNHSGHGEAVAAGRQATAPIGYDHYFQSGDLAPWLAKHLTLAGAEADALAEPTTARGKMAKLAGRGLRRPLLRFLYHYVVRGGFRDGAGGLQYALMYAWYDLTIHLLARSRRGR